MADNNNIGSRAVASYSPQGGESTPRTPDTTSGRNGGRRRNGGQPQGQCRRNRNKGQEQFQGKIDDLKGHTYDIHPIRSGADTFTTTTREIGEYVARSYKGDGEFIRAMHPDVLAFDALVDPESTPPTNVANLVQMKIWEGKLKTYNDSINTRTEVSRQAYAVVLGQCSQTIRDRLSASALWAGIQANTDLMGLLRLIRESLYTGATTKKPTESLQEAEEGLLGFRQGENMTNSNYLDKFRSLVERVEHHGSEIGCTPGRMQTHLTITAADPLHPTAIEISHAKTVVTEEYLAVLFLRKSDPKRYGSLVSELQNNHTRGTDQYPMTISHAYDMLVNYRNPQSTFRFDRQDHGVSFYTEEDGNEDDTDTRGPSGGRGQGRGRGNGRGRGGRGQGRYGRGPSASVQVNEETNEPCEHVMQTSTNSSDDVTQYLSHRTSQPTMTSIEHVETLLNGRGRLPESWILLDTCSSADLISNPSLLKDIHTVDRTMNIRCNAGYTSTNQMGYMGDYPVPVWYNPEGIANILSLDNVS